MKKIVFVLTVMIFLCFTGCGDNNNSSDALAAENEALRREIEALQNTTAAPVITYEVDTTPVPTTTEKITEKPTEPPTTTEKPTEPPTTKPELSYKTYGAGQYKVGVDIPAGEYLVLADSGRSGYFKESIDANGKDIIKNDNFDNNSIIMIHDGNYFELSRCKAISLNEAPNITETLSTLSDGMYKAGLHFPAGEYKLQALEGNRAYYCIYDSSDQQKIVANNNFANTNYININEGQYLKLQRCSMNLPEREQLYAVTEPIFQTQRDTENDMQKIRVEESLTQLPIPEPTQAPAIVPTTEPPTKVTSTQPPTVPPIQASTAALPQPPTQLSTESPTSPPEFYPENNNIPNFAQVSSAISSSGTPSDGWVTRLYNYVESGYVTVIRYTDILLDYGFVYDGSESIENKIIYYYYKDKHWVVVTDFGVNEYENHVVIIQFTE